MHGTSGVRAFSLRFVSEPTCAMPAALRSPLLPPPLMERFRLVLEVPTEALASPAFYIGYKMSKFRNSSVRNVLEHEGYCTSTGIRI